MDSLNPTLLITFALIFITVFFWVQTFYAYWQSFFVITNPDSHLDALFTFTILLTVITVLAILVFRQSSGKKPNMPIDAPDEIFNLDEEAMIVGLV